MTFRSRPAPRRRHRARWEDELRTQRLLVGAFAAAIAIALGLFGLVAWNGYVDSHLRQVMWVEGTTVLREDFDLRQRIIATELEATAIDLNGQIGGARDAILNQQLQAVSDQYANLPTVASNSLLDGRFQATRAPGFGIVVSEDEVDAEISERQSLPERVQLSLIEIDALLDSAPAGAKPTEADFARAEAQAELVLAELDEGVEWATLATRHSDDVASAQLGGVVGWVEATDAQYGDLVPLAAGAGVGDVVGPRRIETGVVVLRIDGRTEAGPFAVLIDRLAANRVSPDDYRAYVRDELVRRRFRTYFAEQVAVTPAPQRKVAQILILADQGVPVPQLRVRHLLAQPLPGADDQSSATQEQWDAALDRAEAWHLAVQEPDADWFALAEESDDPGSRGNGGDLGWYDPTSSTFIEEFKAAVAELSVGEISPPVRTEFGYHVIQVTDQRTSALAFAEDLVRRLAEDPDSFAELARTHSEDSSTRDEGGVVGWVARYETTPVREAAIFGLEERSGAITSQPVVDGNQIFIFQLLDWAERREIEENRLTSIRAVGYSRWYDALKDGSQIWVDPLLLAAGAPT